MIVQRLRRGLFIPGVVSCWMRSLINTLRLPHFEFWNTHLFHFPVYLYWLYLSCKARSLFFFSAANPGIETGGMMGESKVRILDKIDPAFLPKSLYIEPGRFDGILDAIEGAGIQFPLIVKPDVGQGGWMVRLVNSEKELFAYLRHIKIPFLIQEYVNEPLEVGILYYRIPGEERGVISSFAIKQFLQVTGDGASSLGELINRHPRGKCIGVRLEMLSYLDCASIPAKGEKVVVSFKGNHSYGTTFINAAHLIDEQLTQVFDSLCKPIEGFYFGRFDIRCESVGALKSGWFKIVELNGAGSEPLHIFDPSMKLTDAYASAFAHWDIIYRISKLNRRNGNEYMKLDEARRYYAYMRNIQAIHGAKVVIGN